MTESSITPEESSNGTLDHFAFGDDDLRMSELRDGLVHESRTDELSLRKELRFIKERAGWSSDGIPLNTTRMGQLAAEDFGWNSYTSDSQFDAYSNRGYMASYLAYKYNSDPIARNIANAYTFFTFGGGFTISHESEAEDYRFIEWSERNSFVNFQKKLIQEQFLFGNAPVVLYPLTWEEGREDEPQPGEAIPLERPTKAKEFRYIPDSRLVEILRSREDYTKVLGYRFEGMGWVAPCDVISFSVETLGTSLRGSSILTPVLTELLMLHKFAEARFYLNLTRSRLPIIRKAQSQTGAAAQASALSSLPKAGSVLRIGAGEDIQFPSLNVDSGNAADDYRLLILRVASGVSLPEYLVSQDASNSNYASTLVAESPAHNMFRSYQRVFGRQLMRLLAELGFDRCSVDAPAVVPRDFKADAEGLQVAIANGLCSTMTASERLGFDWETEVDRMSAPAPSLPFPLEGTPIEPTGNEEG